jgi:hypothetical protein
LKRINKCEKSEGKLRLFYIYIIVVFENNDIIDSCEKSTIRVNINLEDKMSKTGAKKTQIEKKVDAKIIFKHVLRGLRNSIIFAAMIIALLLVVSTIVAVATKSNILSNMYMSCYYGSIFILIVSIPQFYKRKKIGKARQVRHGDTMFGFYGWFGNKYEDETMEKSYEEFQGDGFWLGIMILTVGIIMLATAVILESIFFM